MSSDQPSKVVAVKRQVKRIDSRIDELSDSLIFLSLPLLESLSPLYGNLYAVINVHQLLLVWFG